MRTHVMKVHVKIAKTKQSSEHSLLGSEITSKCKKTASQYHPAEVYGEKIRKILKLRKVHRIFY